MELAIKVIVVVIVLLVVTFIVLTAAGGLTGKEIDVMGQLKDFFSGVATGLSG